MKTCQIASLLLLVLACAGAQASTLTKVELVKALRRGGNAIVLRHASSPREVPDKKSANRDNTKLERQLDTAGRNFAVAFGNALRALKIPIQEVLCSPTYRALETVRFAKLLGYKVAPELGDGGESMGGVTVDRAAWLAAEVTKIVPGANRILVTHSPNIAKAFPNWTTDFSEGEALVIGRDSNGMPTALGRIKIEEWPQLPEARDLANSVNVSIGRKLAGNRRDEGEKRYFQFLAETFN